MLSLRWCENGSLTNCSLTGLASLLELDTLIVSAVFLKGLTRLCVHSRCDREFDSVYASKSTTTVRLGIVYSFVHSDRFAIQIFTSHVYVVHWFSFESSVASYIRPRHQDGARHNRLPLDQIYLLNII